MDAAYYPSSNMVRQQGVLELIAASVSEEHFQVLERNTFTRALNDQLRTRAMQRGTSPLTAAELHSKLLSSYPKLIPDNRAEKETIYSFPSPLHMQTSGNARLPSILLAPFSQGSPSRPGPLLAQESAGGSQVHLAIHLANDEPIDIDSWTEWMRMMPDGIRDIRVDGPYSRYR